MDWSRPSPSSPTLPARGPVQSDRPVGPDWTEPYPRPGPSGLVDSLCYSSGSILIFLLHTGGVLSSNLGHSALKPESNAGRNCYLSATRFSIVSVGKFLNFWSENDAMCAEKFSTLARKILGLPTSGWNMQFLFHNFPLSGWEYSLNLNPEIENQAIMDDSDFTSCTLWRWHAHSIHPALDIYIQPNNCLLNRPCAVAFNHTTHRNPEH